MDHYPEVNISERECSSRRASNSSSINKSNAQPTLTRTQQDGHLSAPQYTSFPSPSKVSAQSQQTEHRTRNDSIHSSSSTAHEDDAKLHHIEAECAQYMDAPPPYSEKQYEGKSEDEQTRMRMADYAKELKRMMGRQLVRGLKTGDKA